MNTKHTPGDWKVEECHEVGIFNQSYQITAKDPQITMDPEERVIVCRLPTGMGEHSQQFHNAKLIGQTPDLLAFALKVAKFHPSLFPEVHDLIRKATGEPVVTAAQHNAYPKGRWT